MLAAFHHSAAASCLDLTARSVGFAHQAPALAETIPARSIEQRHANWASQLPEEPAELWAFLTGLEHDSRMALFAHCAARTLNAVQEPEAGARRPWPTPTGSPLR